MPRRVPRHGHRVGRYDAEVTTRYHVAVRRPEDGRLLVLGDGALPGFSSEAAPPWPVVSPVVDGLAALGLTVVALRAAWVDDPRLALGGLALGGLALGGVDAEDTLTRTATSSHRLYEAAWLGGVLPAGADWVPLEALERRPTPLGRAIDAGALEPASGVHQPWYRGEWLPDMVSWIDERLAAIGRRRRGRVRQVRSWARSALLSVETDGGPVWAKQVPEIFAHEVAVTALLADLDPGVVAPLIAGDVRSGRMLMEHVSGPLLADTGDPAAWLATMARLAELQRVLAADLTALEVAGVPHAPSADLDARLTTLVAVSPDWNALEPSLAGYHEDLRVLCDSVIGASLEHGDLSARQVIMGEMGPVFLDWSDATVTHPFLAAAGLLDDPAHAAGRQGNDPRALTLEYLAGWHGEATSGERELAAARRIRPLHAARECQDRILPGLDQPWELAWLIPALLARAATVVDQRVGPR